MCCKYLPNCVFTFLSSVVFASLCNWWLWPKWGWRRAAFTVVLFLFLKKTKENVCILCMQLPARGPGLIVGGLPSVGSYPPLQDGSGLALLHYRVCHTVNVTCDYCHMVLEANSSQVTAAQLLPFKWGIKARAAHRHYLLLLQPTAKASGFPRWVPTDVLDVSWQIWCWLCHQVAVSNTLTMDTVLILQMPNWCIKLWRKFCRSLEMINNWMWTANTSIHRKRTANGELPQYKGSHCQYSWKRV